MNFEEKVSEGFYVTYRDLAARPPNLTSRAPRSREIGRGRGGSQRGRIAVAGKTFRYSGPEGLAGSKRVIIAVARGSARRVALHVEKVGFDPMSFTLAPRDLS